MNKLIMYLNEYIRKVGTILSKRKFTIPTGIPQFDRINIGVHEIVGNTSSGRTTFCLHVAKTCIEAGILPLWLDLSSKLSIEQILQAGVDPRYLLVGNLMTAKDIEQIVLDGAVKLIIVEELGVLGNSMYEFLERLNKSLSIKSNVTVLIVNQLRKDLSTGRSVSYRSKYLRPYISSTISLKRIEKRLGGILTRIVQKQYSRNLTNKTTVLLKHGKIPQLQNKIVYLVQNTSMKVVKGQIYYKGNKYTYPICMKNREFVDMINNLTTQLQNKTMDESMSTKRYVLKKPKSGIGLYVNTSPDEEVIEVHPSRIEELE